MTLKQSHPWTMKRCRTWLLRFADPRRPYPLEPAAKEIPQFVAAVSAASNPTLAGGALTLDEANQIRALVVENFKSVSQDGAFEIQARDLEPLTSISAVAGRGYYSGSIRDMALLAVRDFLTSAHGKPIARCAGPNCPKLIVRQRRQRYCSKKCALKAEARQARKRRAEISVAKKYDERRRRHLAKVSRSVARGPYRRPASLLAQLEKLVESECPDARPGNLHGRPDGYQHRVTWPSHPPRGLIKGVIECLTWGEHTDLGRSPNQIDLEEELNRGRPLPVGWKEKHDGKQ